MNEKTSEKDSLYRKGMNGESFTFNDQVAEVFDDMVDRSVPLYSTVIDGIAMLLARQEKPDLKVLDLGCSTGTTLLELSRRLHHPGLELVGIDNAPSMLERARRKAAMFSGHERIRFLQADLEDCSLSGADVILCNYTLQFTRPMVRPALMNRFFEALPDGGLLIVSEKVLASGPFHHDFIAVYHEFKRRQGYSELEIAAKREALENVLVPFTVEENLQLFRQAGFNQVEIFCKWFNFASFVAVK